MLLSEIASREAAEVFEYARTRLLASPGLAESLGWQGLPWRWCYAYAAADAPGRPAAFLVPDPASPRIAAPLAHRMIAQLTMRKLQRAVKDGILKGSVVGEMRWCTWELTGRAVVDEVVTLVMARTEGAG